MNGGAYPRVAVVANDPLVRNWLAAALADAGVNVTAHSSPQILHSGWTAEADVVLWDMGWNPSAELEQLADGSGRGLPTVVLLPDDEHTRVARDAGATGVLQRDAPASKLLAALVAAAAGLLVMDRDLAEPIMALHPGSGMVEPLTTRETEVLQLLAEGAANKVIARQLHISEHTAKYHVASIMGKLDAESRTEAVVRAARLGLVHI